MVKKRAVSYVVAVICLIAVNIYLFQYVPEETEKRMLAIPQQYINIIMIVVVDIVALFVFLRRHIFSEFFGDIFLDRQMVLNLSKNDFKTRFAGSFLGIFWAFVQPIVTVILYWFVFEKALNVGSQSTKAGITVPYVLWLIAGLVPWFYFSEAWGMGTNVLVEYSYLVKKVVFKISVLPVVKIVSSLFVHLFFVGFTIIMYCCYRCFPGWSVLQLFYYTGCMIVFTLGLAYLTSALVVFFRDLSQIISIMMQVLMWMTPILWNIDAMNLNPIMMIILKMNPMLYIVMGYRDSLINGIWFWQRPEMTIYFWTVTILLFEIGITVFKKLRVHFADVL